MKRLALASGLVLVAGLGVYAAKESTDYSKFNEPLTKDQEVIHVLDRVSYGPRAGDVEAVQKMGVKKWIDQQLHPDRIPENPELAVMLQPLDSLRMSTPEIVAHYPPQQVVRAIAQGKMAEPKDPVARAAVERQVDRLRAKQAKDGKGAAPDLQQAAIENLRKLLTPEQVRTLRNGTPQEKAQLLDSFEPDQRDQILIAMPQGMRQQMIASADPQLRRKLQIANAPQNVVPSDMMEAKLYRSIYSTHQLEEQMVDFWYNHFNVYLDKGADRILAATYERDAIRPHVFGKFRDLLEATANSPAMMFYLDNWESVSQEPQQTGFFARRAKQAKQGKQAKGLNENYARELMELHTLGVDGGYTQKDIIEVARAFTGWTIKQPNLGGDFVFDERVHDKGEKTVLDVKIPAGGWKNDGEKVLDILARHPSTARFISTKLARKFVADDPPPALIDRMAKTFHDTDGDIRAVLTTMFESKEFMSQGAWRAKVKTPLEAIVSSVRATGAQVTYAVPLANQIGEMGQPLYRKLEPTGYSSANAEWVNSSALLARMNFGIALTDNKIAGATLDATKFSTQPDETAKQVLFHDPNKETLASIQRALMQKEPTPALVAGLVLGSPDFQRR